MRSDPPRCRSSALFALLCGLSCGIAVAPAARGQAPAFLVKDVDPRLDAQGSGAARFVSWAGQALFAAATPTTGLELWRTDGSPTGTALVRDLRPGARGSEPVPLSALADLLVFVADDGEHGREPWVTDGTAEGTALLADIRPGQASSNVSDAVVLGGALYFTAEDAVNGRQIWRSDGTPEGTTLAVLLENGTQPANPEQLTVLAGELFFVAFQQATGRELWKTDGTPDGTRIVADVYEGPGSSAPTWLVRSGALLFFSADDGLGAGTELWASDGIAGAQLVKDVAPGPASSFPLFLSDYGGTLLFNAGGEGSGQVWRSDGTEEGTVLVADIPVDPHENAGGFQTALGLSFFFANGLRRTDGTPEGTVLLAGSVFAADRVELGGLVYFVGFSPATGNELWATDGTALGTVPLPEIRAGPEGSQPRDLARVGGALYFGADDGTHGVEPWRSDGTPAGTALVADVHRPRAPDPIFPSVAFPFDFDGQLLFQGNDGTSGLELWKSDGTQAGTALLADLHPGLPGSAPGHFARLGDRVLFAATTRLGSELYGSDGTAFGTRLVRDLYPGDSSHPGPLVGLESVVLFAADDGVTSRELWRSDGTAAGTVLVKDIRPGPPASPSYPTFVATIGGDAFFYADDFEHGLELWRSDGTEAGTIRLTDVPPAGAHDGLPGQITPFGPWIYWVSSTAAGSIALRRSDASFAAFETIREVCCSIGGLHAAGDQLLFFATDEDGAVDGLWRSDGTPAGTSFVGDLVPGETDLLRLSQADQAVAGGLLFFELDHPATGRELWRSDGTAAGTLPLELRPGPAGADPAELREIGGVLVFSADDGTGREPWATDGSPAGTRRLAEIAAPGGSEPRHFTASGALVYFAAVDDESGEALWALPRGAVTDPDQDGLELLQERQLGSDPNDPDSDGDGLEDGLEVALGTHPAEPDSDADGLGDGAELAGATDPLDGDSDDDGLSDARELAGGTNPLDPDGDGDGFADGVEFAALSDPWGAAWTPVVPPATALRSFDFEDGTQGWQPWRGAARTETDQLGGSFAIAGESGAGLALVADLTGTEAILLDALLLGDGAFAPPLLAVHATPVDGLGAPTGPGVLLPPSEPAAAAAHPNRRRIALEGLAGTHLVALLWGVARCAPEAPLPCPGVTASVLVDDVELAPEPGAALAGAGAALALAAIARRRPGARRR